MNTDFLQSFLYFVNTLPASAGTVVFGGFRFGIFGWGGDARTRGSGRGCPRTCGHCVLALTDVKICPATSQRVFPFLKKIKEDLYCKLSIHKTTRKIFTGFSEAYHSRMSAISAYVLSLLAIQCSTARESTVVLIC